MPDEPAIDLLELTTDIVSAHVAHNSVAVADLAGLIARVHAALASLGAPQVRPGPELVPAVPVRVSVKPDHIVCLEDGKKFKTLKRHLASDHGMTPADYRAKWDLPASYPMAAPNYSAKRRDLAKSIGLGRKPGTKLAARAVAATSPSKTEPAASPSEPSPARDPAAS